VTRNELLAAFLLLSGACSAEIGDTEDPELEEAEVMTMNAMTMNAMTMNALSANFEATQALIENALETKSFDGSVPALAYQLSDPLTQSFMHYLVGCALDPSQSVSYEDKFAGGAVYTWPGELGLCPEWNWDKPSEQCQEVVSACLLARVNAFGVPVALRIQGHDSTGNAIDVTAAEAAAYPWREGSFYGNVFGQSNLATGVDIFVDDNGELHGREGLNVKGAIYRNMFACWSSVWTYAAAYEKDRVCAGSSVNCAATPVGACRYHPTTGPTYRSYYNDDPYTAPPSGVADKDYQASLNKAATVRFKHGLTTFLDDPCALYPDSTQNCQVTYAALKYGPSAYATCDAKPGSCY
jgi:hypothetical protein